MYVLLPLVTLNYHKSTVLDGSGIRLLGHPRRYNITQILHHVTSYVQYLSCFLKYTSPWVGSSGPSNCSTVSYILHFNHVTFVLAWLMVHVSNTDICKVGVFACNTACLHSHLNVEHLNLKANGHYIVDKLQECMLHSHFRLCHCNTDKFICAILKYLCEWSI
jgi:hypothetical protein